MGGGGRTYTQMVETPIQDLGTIESTEPLEICKDKGGRKVLRFLQRGTRCFIHPYLARPETTSNNSSI
jgi:hypothetical protein